MLVLSRKAGQELIIGGGIRITINRIRGNRVTLGIQAPDDVRIVRGELEPVVRAFDLEDGQDAADPEDLRSDRRFGTSKPAGRTPTDRSDERRVRGPLNLHMFTR